mmetsp:Transcript_87048/g.106772  ORF Transcript_87048/g.106772 Transcript_87048/m.106772 type:complete len:106 (+) Transcript_87048:86-403(+)
MPSWRCTLGCNKIHSVTDKDLEELHHWLGEFKKEKETFGRLDWDGFNNKPRAIKRKVMYYASSHVLYRLGQKRGLYGYYKIEKEKHSLPPATVAMIREWYPDIYY